MNVAFPPNITHVMQDSPNDCLRSCYAMILGINKSLIPRFFDSPNPENEEINFLQQYGLTTVRIPFVIDGTNYYEPEVTIARLSQSNPGMPFILVVEGPSSAGVHTIVISKEGYIFDPAKSYYGNISNYFPFGAARYGKLYWITYLIPPAFGHDFHSETAR